MMTNAGSNTSRSELGAWFSKLMERQEGFWPWIEIPVLDKKRANKFLLGCLLDFQIKAERAWENARKLAEDYLPDPDELWHVIAAVEEDDWLQRRAQYGLHRFHWVHTRVREVAITMVVAYHGDARNIWERGTPSEVFGRLQSLGIGEQRSRMAVGALIDTGHLTGRGDVKADIHVRRVLGRVFSGQALSEGEATRLARELSPESPWLIDRPAYLIGKRFCTAADPQCELCPANDWCSYFKHRR